MRCRSKAPRSRILSSAISLFWVWKTFAYLLISRIFASTALSSSPRRGRSCSAGSHRRRRPAPRPGHGVPAGFEGLKIVQISNIHSGRLTRTEPLIKAVEKINALKPDLFFFTGDLVNDLATEVDPYIDIFKTIKSKYGNFSITGNHDYSDYMKWDSATAKMANFKALVDSHQKMGWKILLNENHIIENESGEKLAIIGIENSGCSICTIRQIAQSHSGQRSSACAHIALSRSIALGHRGAQKISRD